MADPPDRKMYSNYPKHIFRTNKLTFMIGGEYMPRPSASKLLKAFFYSYNVFCIAYCQIYYTPAELMMIGVTIKNVSDLIEHVGMILMHFFGTFKMVTLYVKRKSILAIMKQLNDDELKYEDYDDFKPANIIGTNLKAFNRIATVFFVLGSFVPLSKIIGAFNDFRVRGSLIDTGNVTCFEVLPYFARFPFETNTSNGCLLALIVQTFPMVAYAWQIIAYDMLFSGLCLNIRAHLLVIQGAFKSMRGRSLAALGLPKDFEVFNDVDHDALNAQMRKEMRKTSVHLQTIITVCDEMEDIFNIGSLGQALVAMFVMISCLYVMSMEEMFSPTFTALLHFFLTQTLQVGFYCTFGNEITYESLNVNGAIYETDWYAASPSYKSSMIINMQRMQNPLYLTIGKFTPWTLATLLSILRGSYSYFTVLKQTT